MITYHYTSRENLIFIEMCRKLNNELELLLSGSVNPTTTRANKTEDFTDVVIAFMDEIPVGCVALRPFSKEYAEIKRMYVVAQKRKSGIGMYLLNEIIQIAVEKGYKAVVLETNEKLYSAKMLYLKAGFSKMESYGPYALLDETLCMKKDL